MVINFNIKTDLPKTQKYIRALITKVPAAQKETARKALNDMRDIMVKKIMKIPSSGQGQSIHDTSTLIISEINKDKNNSTFRLRNTNPHAVFLEFGVSEHWIWVGEQRFASTEASLRTAEWARSKNIDPNIRFAKVGGPGSALELGNSRYQFFYNSIDQYLASGKLDRELSKNIDKAIK